MSFGRGVLWRNLGQPVRLGPFDGRALFFILLAVYHIALWTFVLCVVAVLALFLIERQGYTIPNLIRRLQVLLAGPLRPHQSARNIRSDQ